MKNQKSKFSKLALKKFKISKLNNLSQVHGGGDVTYNPKSRDCPPDVEVDNF